MVFTRQRRKLKQHAVEKQRGYCAVCARPIHGDIAHRSLFGRGDGSLPAGVLSIDPADVRHRDNVYAACSDCVSRWDGVMTLDEMRELVRNPPKKVEKPKTIYPETRVLIAMEIAKLTDEHISVAPHYQYAPPDKAKQIAETLVRAVRRVGRNKLCPITNPKTLRRQGRPSGEKNRNLRRRLLGEQNHRCCYCGFHMLTERAHGEPHSRDPVENLRFATFEHITNAADGGTFDWENLAMACMICNNWRSALEMDAVEYYEFLQKNPSFIEDRIHDVEERVRAGKKRIRPSKAERIAQRDSIRERFGIPVKGTQRAFAGTR